MSIVCSAFVLNASAAMRPIMPRPRPFVFRLGLLDRGRDTTLRGTPRADPDGR
jgi:hypothetical protein